MTTPPYNLQQGAGPSPAYPPPDYANYPPAPTGESVGRAVGGQASLYSQPGLEPYGVVRGYDPGGAPPFGYVPASQNGTAVVSLVFGICGLSVIPVIGSIVALATGYPARSQIAQTGAQGAGLATAGIVLGWIGLGLFLLGLIAVIVMAVAFGAFAGAMG